ncbi:MAG: hypothetical protein E7270_03280 [Lachnospiraceae bacterium]|nr:hypothetical protein [Lachnospiraceae bacterium]
MDKEKELLFVKNFIIKPKRERILYELASNKKRKNAISRFCHMASDYIDIKKIVYEGDVLNGTKLLEIIRKFTKKNIGYVISWDDDVDGTFLDIDLAISKAIEDYMVTIVIIDNVALIKTEQEDGAAKSYILKI